ncbi:hypothetical protein M422DRAFT_275879 [Sphaerobolus stellatus SS14]|uniref:Cytochrome P450 n=1 Tax=Sphaerobolus stellatus (strain SS14) TaxID=990650 RepID=A0A0C9UDM0_SPHS4|nr:hypothetical protein M422DRAFT_275879 [Sphaerobolus stellatus SS14]
MKRGAHFLTTAMINYLIILTIPLIWYFRRKPIPKGLRLPPGPPGLPIIGNLFDMPKRRAWLTFARWGKEYGDLVYVKVLGINMLYVNSEILAQELFERRSVIYSDRLANTMIYDILDLEWALAFTRYGSQWRRYRRLFHDYVRQNNVAQNWPIQSQQCRKLLRNLLRTPQGYSKHIRHMVGAIIMEIAYGVDVKPKDDPYLKMTEVTMQAVGESAIFGSFMVDFIPLLKYIPTWFPGAEFQRKAKVWREAIKGVLVQPFEAGKKAIESGLARPSMASLLLHKLDTKQKDLPGDEEEAIRDTLGSTMIGGTHSTTVSLEIFMLAMACNQDAQKKAQEEIDRVIGFDRLVEFEDRDSLPYTNAIVKETLRWQPLLPLGIPHRLMEDDIYGEYFIPKGTLVLGNAWFISHTESFFGPDTDKFQPERFLRPDVPYPTMAFGYGRRICPGRQMADETMFITIASILQIFSIRPSLDEQGREVNIIPDFSDGIFSCPLPFSCRITPRSTRVEELLSEAETLD